MAVEALGNPGSIGVVLRRMRERGPQPALFWNEREYSYTEFLGMVDDWRARLAARGIGPGSVCAVLGDYSLQSCATLWALMLERAIVVPLTWVGQVEIASFLPIAGVQSMVRFDPQDAWTIECFDFGQNELVERFRREQRPGLVVFTSGSTGKPKGILHDCERVMKKFVRPRPAWRTVLFLMFDHFGGMNTLFSTFAYGGVAVCLPDRSPDAVARAIEKSRATLLPTTPTFLNLLIASGAFRQYDLGSIRLITYGTEMMPEPTLLRVKEIFPNTAVKQTYGLSELGVLRSRSEKDSSLWVKVGGDGFEVKVVDNLLWVRSEANMVGYLNAPSPFDDQGWMCTGDQVEVRGEYLRFVGRQSEIINVGGQKVFPAEVEGVLLQMHNVREATVYGARDPLMGQVVHARVALDGSEDPERASERLRKGCLEKLARYKIPVRFTIVAVDELRSERFKKIRAGLER